MPIHLDKFMVGELIVCKLAFPEGGLVSLSIFGKNICSLVLGNPPLIVQLICHQLLY